MNRSALKSEVRGMIMANLANAGHAAGPGKKNAIPVLSSQQDDDHNGSNARASSPPPALQYSGQQDTDHAHGAKGDRLPLLSSAADTDHSPWGHASAIKKPYAAKGKG